MHTFNFTDYHPEKINTHSVRTKPHTYIPCIMHVLHVYAFKRSDVMYCKSLKYMPPEGVLLPFRIVPYMIH